MTVGSVSQTFAFTAVQLTVTRRDAVQGRAPGATATGDDRASTSSPAAGAAAPTAAPSDDSPTRASRRSAALFEALDADGDGAVTRDEFTDGALTLLRRAGARRRAEGHDGDDRHQRGHGVHRLERTLGRAFRRADADGDGSLDASELTAALSRADTTERTRAEASPEPATPAGTTTMTLTVVSIAIRRYSAVQDSAAPAESRPNTSADTVEPPHETDAPAAS